MYVVCVLLSKFSIGVGTCAIAVAPNSSFNDSKARSVTTGYLERTHDRMLCMLWFAGFSPDFAHKNTSFVTASVAE